MNKHILKVAIVLLFVSLLSSCRTYFNQGAREVIQSDDAKNIEKIQFYVDRTILLEIQSRLVSENISEGMLKTRNGITYYQIKIKGNTKCLAEDIDPKVLKIRFDKGEEDYLNFKETINGYQLVTTQESNHHYVTFKGRKFKVIEGQDAMLMIKKKHRQRSKKMIHKMNGLSIT
ncbi:hypothetical protein [Reichenbachiella versicolor]|uniref:hypothetical protein n=1 Tax=Reichenbachiella versicolor TaxID=1821036 RepID=UPI000D6E79F9|nr:hypothetical protein [Reichenbachiella versicolor]